MFTQKMNVYVTRTSIIVTRTSVRLYGFQVRGIKILINICKTCMQSCPMTFVSIRDKRTKPHIHKYLSSIYLYSKIPWIMIFLFLVSEIFGGHILIKSESMDTNYYRNLLPYITDHEENTTIYRCFSCNFFRCHTPIVWCLRI